jgi:hypothetical protein
MSRPSPAERERRQIVEWLEDQALQLFLNAKDAMLDMHNESAAEAIIGHGFAKRWAGMIRLRAHQKEDVT